MSLKSAAEDLQARTLRAVSGLLGKLEYLVGLRQEDGSYTHWGLSRVHGDDATQRALGEAHRGVVSAILRTPIRKLLQEVNDSGRETKRDPVDMLIKLNDASSQVVPRQPGAGASRHLSSVLRALANLAKTRP
ncbi:MAG TPA: hypothetical protein VNY29_02650 [Terriglobales bacterium]|jgi:hypothetical protein|nr:hypothetical protein [Terriglobales bacterium]